MGERLESSPTPIAPEAPSRVIRRVGLKFSPQFSPEELFGKDWLVIAEAESPETEAQKPATLNNNSLQSAQEMAARITQRVKEYTSIDFTDRMTIVETIELANLLAKTAMVGIGLPEISAFVAGTIFIEGVKMVAMRGESVDGRDSSKLALIGNIAKKVLVHQVEHEITNKVAEKGVEIVTDQLAKRG